MLREQFAKKSSISKTEKRGGKKKTCDGSGSENVKKGPLNRERFAEKRCNHEMPERGQTNPQKKKKKQRSGEVR